jgi:hypothetical protein
MRKVLMGMALALVFSGAAQASDFIVVNSTDPAIAKGQGFDAGARIALAAGKKLTLMRASGEVTTVLGAAAGVTLPAQRVADSSGKLDTLHALLAPPPEGRTFGARRSASICPPPESLVTLDDIVKVAQGSCKDQARAALDAFVAKAADGK